MAKNNKVNNVMKLLKQGMSVREIRTRMQVSEGYVYQIKKLMKTGVDTVEAAPLELTEEMKLNPTDTSVDAVLDERGKRYGLFRRHAEITQNIKRAMADSPNWSILPVDTREALEMTAHKIGRMLNGDPEYVDNVVDIIGYMQLVLDRMNGKAERGIST